MVALARVSDGLRACLRCPKCQGTLLDREHDLRCDACQITFPVKDGVPVLFNEEQSIFTAADVVASQTTTLRPRPGLARFIPPITKNLSAARNYRHVAELLRERSSRPRVLIVGAGVEGEGMAPLLASGAEIMQTDVAIGPHTQLVCDGHDLPFADGTFDGVVAQAVLEHVLDPARCVAEMHRVLGPDGLVYAETPFMQQVHEGRYDFTRFTQLGHRRLFRYFAEVASGPSGGTGSALAWSLQYFALGFVSNPRLVNPIKGASRLAFGWLRHLDSFTEDKRGMLDGASGYYFLGRRAEEPLPDRELIAQYRGLL